MNIVLCGPDGGGKSWLADVLSHACGMPIVPGEGPAQSPEEINERARRMLAHDGVIFDRHPVISSWVYESVRGRFWYVDHEVATEFYSRDNLIVYCRPTLTQGLKQLTFSPNETQEMKDLVIKKYHRILERYDDWAQLHAHYVYRIGDKHLINLLSTSNPTGRLVRQIDAVQGAAA